MPVAAAIPAVASVVGGKMQADAAGQAGAAQTQAGRDAINAQLAIYNQSRADTLPQQVTGTGALNLLAQLYGLPTYQAPLNTGGITVTGGEPTAKKKKRSFFDKVTDPANLAKQFGGTSYDPLGLFSGSKGGEVSPLQFNVGGAGGGSIVPGAGLGGGGGDFSQFYQTPDYLVAMGEGLRGLDRSLASQGRLGSGGADADRIQFASNLGTQAFGNFTNNLFRLAGFGSQGNQQLNSLGQNFGSAAAQQFGNIGDARASSYANRANAWGSGLGGAIDAFGQFSGSRGAPAQYYAPPSNQFASSFGNNPDFFAGYGGSSFGSNPFGGYGG